MSNTDESSADLRERVIEALKNVQDPEIPIDIYELGLIYDLDLEGEGRAAIRMTLTAPNCPMSEMIVSQVRSKVAAVQGIDDVEVELVWEPRWAPSMMSEAAKLELEFTGHTGPAHLRGSGPTSLTVGRKDRDGRRKR